MGQSVRQGFIRIGHGIRLSVAGIDFAICESDSGSDHRHIANLTGSGDGFRLDR